MTVNVSNRLGDRRVSSARKPPGNKLRGWLRAGVLSSVNQLGSESLALARNVLVARMIGPFEMGTAVTVLLAIRMLEMLSDMSFDRLVIQAPDGNSPRFQANGQALLVVRGALIAMAINLLAWPASLLFGVSPWAYVAISFVPLARGLIHLDYKRLQRSLGFRKTIAVELTSSILVTALAVPLATYVRDYTVVLWIHVAHAFLTTALSHRLAERKYSLRFDAGIVRRFVEYGWPLMLNALILAAVMQGDRLIVAFSFSAVELGRYAVVFQLVSLPAQIVARVASSVMLPLLAKVQDNRRTFGLRLQVCGVILGFLAIVFLVTLPQFAAYVITHVYGPEFLVSTELIHWLTLAAAVSIGRCCFGVSSLALADCRIPLIANLFKLSAVCVAAISAWNGCSLEYIVVATCWGEVMAAFAEMMLLYRRHSLPVRAGVLVLILTMCVSYFL